MAELGRHVGLLEAGGLYAELYHAQFARHVEGGAPTDETAVDAVR